MKKGTIRKVLISLFGKRPNGLSKWLTFPGVAVALTLVFQRPIERFLTTIGGAIFGNDGVSLIGEVAIVMAGFFILILQIRRNTHIKHLLGGIAVSICYCILRFSPVEVAFLRFSFISGIAYLDFTIIFGFLSIFKSYLKLVEDRNAKRKIMKPDYEASDVPIQLPIDDKLNRTTFVNELADRIIGIKSNQVFSLGINGRWGEGKSSILNLLRIRLQDENNIVILEFNPWESLKTGSIFMDFVTQLTETLAEFSNELPMAANSYLKAIGAVAEKGIGINFVENLGNLLDPPRSAREEFSELEKTIGKIEKKVVVLIDDIDRLEVDEIVETLRIIRILGNFQNLTFIATYDKEYAISTLEKTYSNRAEEYLEKVFHEEIPIPPLKGSEFWEFFRMTLVHSIPSDPTILEEIRKGLEYREFSFLSTEPDLMTVSQSVHRLVGTARDAKRLAANFASIVLRLGKEVDSFDLLLMCVLQLKSNGCYTLIKEGTVFKDKDDQVLILEERFLKLALDKMEPSNNEAATSIFKFLFPLTTDKNTKTNGLRRIYQRRNLELIFDRSFQNTISRSEFERYLNADHLSFSKYLCTNLDQGKFEEIEMFLSLNLPEPMWSEDKFKNYLSTILILIGYGRGELMENLLNLMKTDGQNSIEKFFADQEKVSELILECIEKSKIVQNIPQHFLGKIIRGKIYSNTDYQIGKDQAVTICERALQKYLERITNVNEQAMSLFYCCIEDIHNETSLITLSPSACKTLNHFITKYPDGYLATLLRPRMIPDDGYSLCHEPFLWAIFKERADFMEILKNWKPEPADKIRQFLEIVANNGRDNYHHFRSPAERNKFFPIEP